MFFFPVIVLIFNILLVRYIIKAWPPPKPPKPEFHLTLKNHCFNYGIYRSIGFGHFLNTDPSNPFVNIYPNWLHNVIYYSCGKCNKIFAEDPLLKACVEAGGLF